MKAKSGLIIGRQPVATQPGNLYNRLPQSESSNLSLFEDRLVEAHCRFYGAGLSPLTTINEVLVLEAQ